MYETPAKVETFIPVLDEVCYGKNSTVGFGFQYQNVVLIAFYAKHSHTT